MSFLDTAYLVSVQKRAPTVAASVTVPEAEVSSQTKPEEEAEMEVKKMESSESEMSSDEETRDMLASRRYDLCVAKCTYVYRSLEVVYAQVLCVTLTAYVVSTNAFLTLVFCILCQNVCNFVVHLWPFGSLSSVVCQ